MKIRTESDTDIQSRPRKEKEEANVGQGLVEQINPKFEIGCKNCRYMPLVLAPCLLLLVRTKTSFWLLMSSLG